MLKRPLVLKLFALFLLIDPLLRISFISIESEFPFWVVLSKTFALDFKDFFNFWFLFPISGVLLLGVNVFSYVLFILIQLYSLFFHLNYEPYSWPYLSEHPSTTSYLLLTANLIMVAYLLLPRSREIFFDKNLRWWERGSRYSINEDCVAKIGADEFKGKLTDLSFGGALLTFPDAIDIDKDMIITFNILGKKMVLGGQVVRAMENLDGELNYGTQFIFKNGWQKFRLKVLMFSVSKISNYDKFR